MVCPAAQVEDSELTSLADRLGKPRIQRIDKLTIKAHEGTTPETQPAALRASISLLRTLQCAPERLYFTEWSATSDVIREFKALSDIPVLAQAPAGTLKLGLQLVSCGQIADIADECPVVQLPQYIPR